MTRILKGVSVLGLLVLSLYSAGIADATGSPLQISTLHTNDNSPCGTFYSNSYTFTYNGGTVWLSSQFDGNGDIYTDDKIVITVTRPDSSTQTYTKNYGNGSYIVPTAPQNITYLFQQGNNNVQVSMTDLAGPICNSSQYWLVETSSGGGSGAPKPTILPRSAWNGGTSSQSIYTHNPERIAIHHTATSNDPGNNGTFARELQLVIETKPLSVLLNTKFRPADYLNPTGTTLYTDIRGTWPGEIWLVRYDHLNDGDGFDDIGYQYLIDPVGNIYEGTYKGSEDESADVRGSNVWHANTHLIGVSFLGRYGQENTPTDELKTRLDGGVNTPTNASIQSGKSLINWLTSKYSISKTGMTQLDPEVDGITSCVHYYTNPSLCWVDNIAGHKDYGPKTNFSTTCPGDNLYLYLNTFRGINTMIATGSIPQHQTPYGLLIGGFSPLVLGVVDPNGDRLGINPDTGTYEDDITNGVYGNLSLFDHEDGEEPTPYWMHLPNPQSGVYKIDVVGTGNGDFKLATADLGTSYARVMDGSVTNGSKDNYQIIYDTDNPGDIELYHDNEPPVSSASATCSLDMLGICRSNAVIDLTATDTGSNGDPASGVDAIECSYDNKVTWENCGDANGGTFTISDNGVTSFWYRAIDRVENVEEAKFSGDIEVQKFLSIADTLFETNSATTLVTTGILHSNGDASFHNNTTVTIDTLNYIGSLSQSGNTTFNITNQNQVSNAATTPNYPLSYYENICDYHSGNLTLNGTSHTYNECMYVTGNVLIRDTRPKGSLTIISEGTITDETNRARVTAWDTQNGILYFAANGYTTTANKAQYTGVIYAPNADVQGNFSNTTLNGAMFGDTVGFGSGTSLTANQEAGFPPTTHALPL